MLNVPAMRTRFGSVVTNNILFLRAILGCDKMLFGLDKKPSISKSSSSSSWREAFSRSLPPLRSFARTVGPPLAAGLRSLLHPCSGRSGGSRWSMVDHRRVSTSVKAVYHPSSWCRFVGSGLLVHHFEVWRRESQSRQHWVTLPFDLAFR